MAKRGSRRKDGANEQTEILRAIWNEMKALNGRIDTLRTELKSEIAELRDRTERGFDTLGGRIDNLLRGEHGREHAELRERVVRLEERVGLRSGGGT